MGPLLDGIHGRVQLLEYDWARLELVGLHSSWSVIALLGTFYAVFGGALVALDTLALGDRSASGASRTVAPIAGATVPRMAAAAGATAALLQLSAALYARGVPYTVIHAALAPCALGCWAVFDGSLQGLLMSSVAAVAAPFASEIILMQLGLWHYRQPDVFIAGQGIVSWVMWCYFGYTSSLGLLARLLWRQLQQPDTQVEL
ncbi:hypothetical protein WJX81_002776 [Elliptochloris bilobata]|uniref:Uncharacterized protein n=1 Tax=Elliptochloris bilobata TaxID=381761 RepID=A0AAW1RAP9_9CHLO